MTSEMERKEPNAGKPNGWQKAGKCLAALLGVFVAGAVFAAEPNLDAWKADLFRLYDMTPVKGLRVTSAEKKSVWQAFRKQFGDMPVQMGRTTCVATNAHSRMVEQTCMRENGDFLRVAYSLSSDATIFLCMTVIGCEDKAEVDALSTLRHRAYPQGFGRYSVFEDITLHDNDRTEVKGLMTGEIYASPFEKYRFFFIDGNPNADWEHSAWGVYLSADHSKIAVFSVREPLAVIEDGKSVRMKEVVCGRARVANDAGATPLKRLRAADVEVRDFPVCGSGYTKNCHVLLISGGCNIPNNHGRYWNEVCFAYNVLVKSYGIPRENVTVLYAGGDPDKDLCRNGRCATGLCTYFQYETDRLADFDLDGNEDIDGAATIENVRQVLGGYRQTLTAADQLFIFISDHGGQYGTKRSRESTVCLWRNDATDDLKDTEFASLTKGIPCPVMAAIKTCYGGGMIEEFVSSSDHRLIATASDYDQSNGGARMGKWTYDFFGALCGYYPAGESWDSDLWQNNLTGEIFTKEPGPMDPRHVRDECTGADMDNDGRVSFWEAAVFADKNNPWTASNGCKADDIDTPQYRESGGSVQEGKLLFMVQYEDIPSPVREKVSTPSLNPSASASLFAPYVVKVSCGTAGATIRYTLDGSEPVNGSPCCEYGKNEIVITKDCTLSVRAFKSDMDPSDIVRADYKVRKTAPETPYLTAVSLGDSSTGIIVNWIVGEGTESVDILRSEDSGMSNPKAVATGLSPDDIAYADMSAVPGKTYYYRVRANNAYGSSLSAISRGAGLQLMPPTGLKATVSNVKLTTADVALSWNAVTGATHYRVWRVADDGTTSAITGWIAERTFKDSVSYKAGGTTLAYFVKAAGNSAGANASPACVSLAVPIRPDSTSWTLVFCESYPKWVSQSVVETGRTAVKPGEEASMCILLKYADGTYETKTFLSGITWDVASGSGLTLEGANGRYTSMWEGSGTFSPYEPPKVTVKADGGAVDQIAKVRGSCTIGGASLSGEFQVVVSKLGVVERMSISGPDFVIPGKSSAYGVNCKFIGSSWSLDDLPEGTEAEWSIVSGNGITLDQDGVATGWKVTAKTTATIQAKVDTVLGPVYATKTVSISPSVVTRQDAVIPPLGGSCTNYVGWLPQQTVCTADESAWLSGYGYLGSKTKNVSDADMKLSVEGGRPNGSMVSLEGRYLFLVFKAERNPAKDRECLVRLRWDGGGIDFTIKQQEAPVANNPNVHVVEDGLSASAQSDGSVVRYATDGEEPSENSPVLDGTVHFSRNTPVAVKAFGDWMQDSETFYGDVEGGEKVATVTVTFDPVESGITVPEARTYKVTDMFGELPTLEKDGRFFHGWTLYKGSSRRVNPGDYVPTQDAVLFARWSGIPEDEPDWTALPWNFKSSMTGFVKVYDETTGAWLETAIVGVEDASGVCRGSSKSGFGDFQDERNGVNGLCVFGIYGNVETGAETGLKFRVWVPGKGYATVLNPDVNYTADASLGTEASPYVLNVKSALTSTLVLRPGWNWISLPLMPVDATLEAVFAGVTFNEDDIIKGGGTAQSTYSGGKWNGSLKSLMTGECYLLYRAASANATVVVSGTEPDGAVAVKSGWNMIGPMGTAVVPREALTHNGGFAEDDVIKSDSSEQMTYSGGKWNGALKGLQPGVGYKAYLKNAGTLLVK